MALGVLSLAFCLALIAFLEKVLPQQKGLDFCTREACRVVQFSGFSEIMGIPITLVAACLLGLALLLFLFEKAGVDLILAFLLGAEGYLTFIEFFYLEGKCPLCIAFLSALLFSFLLVPKDSAKALLSLGGLGFFGLHFLFFFPDAEPRSLPSDDPRGVTVEVFLEPGQERLLEELEGYLPCRAELVKRYVSGRVSRYEVLEAIARDAFLRPTGTAVRLSEKALRRNERELEALGNGPLPVFVLKEKGKVISLSRGDWRGLLPFLEEHPPIFLAP